MSLLASIHVCNSKVVVPLQYLITTPILAPTYMDGHSSIAISLR